MAHSSLKLMASFLFALTLRTMLATAYSRLYSRDSAWAGVFVTILLLLGPFLGQMNMFENY